MICNADSPTERGGGRDGEEEMEGRGAIWEMGESLNSGDGCSPNLPQNNETGTLGEEGETRHDRFQP